MCVCRLVHINLISNKIIFCKVVIDFRIIMVTCPLQCCIERYSEYSVLHLLHFHYIEEPVTDLREGSGAEGSCLSTVYKQE